MNRLILIIIVLLTGLLLVVSHAKAASLDGLVSEALEANASLKVAETRWRQAEQKAPQVTSLDDPMVSFAFSNYPTDSWESDATPMTGNEIRLSQKFPFPGKLAAKGDVAEAQAEWFEAIYRDSRYQVAYKVKDAYYQLYYLDRAITITERSMAVVDEVIRLAETRYAVGNGLLQDVLKAQVERSRFLDRLWQLEQKRTTVHSNLQALLERFEDILIDFPQTLEITPVDPTLSQLLGAAEKQRPRLVAYESLVARFAAQTRLARLNYKPDVTLWAGYRFRDDDLPDQGTDFASLGLSFNLPVYQAKRDAALAEAEAAKRSALHQKNAFHSRLKRDITTAYAQMEQARDQARLYEEGLIPQATQAFQATMSAYQVGQVDFIALFDALLTLHRLEMEQVKSVTEHQRSVARLEAESGVPLIGADSSAMPADKT